MDDDQERFLEEARKVVREQAYFMKKALDSANLREALRHSSNMLAELRTSLLSPRTYYVLFMQLFDELRVLESYFKEEYRRGRKMSDLYESVQHATNIIPRLYLLITVGAVYIETQEVNAREILSDLLEMVKGVQHPLRGLFLRYYFLKMCKDKLPDVGNEYEGEGGDVNDSVNCILNNLAEMNKLWIRMQGSKDKPRREKERIDLKVTVGENLHRLSGLEGVSQDMYKDIVLPKLLELIVNCKDHLSQQYLIDCLIQTFPDEFHLQNLELLLQTFTTSLQPNVDIKTHFIRLMDRLADFALNNETISENIPQDIDIFKMFKSAIDKIIEDNTISMELKKLLDLQAAFLNFSLRCYPQKSDYVNLILRSCVMICEKQSTSEFDEESQKNIVKFLTMPLETMSLTILQMNEYPNLMQYLPFQKKRQVAIKICQAVVNLRRIIDDIQISEQLITFIMPILKSDENQESIDQYEFEEEQLLVSKILHLIQGKSIEETYKILEIFKEQLLQGGQDRLKHTIPSLVFAYIRLTQQINDQSQDNNNIEQCTEIVKLCKILIDSIAGQIPEIALKMYMNLILCINHFDSQSIMDEFTYDLATSAMTIYEDEIAVTESKIKALNIMIGTLSQTHCLSFENYDTLITNTTQYSAKLLKKNEQCQAVLQCTHLFYNQFNKNEQRVFECFKKCLKLAEICLNQNILNIQLYINIINKFFFFYNQSVSTLQSQDIQQCIAKVQEKIESISTDKSENAEAIKNHWINTINYINNKKSNGDEKYQDLM